MCWHRRVGPQGSSEVHVYRPSSLSSILVVVVVVPKDTSPNIFSVVPDVYPDCTRATFKLGRKDENEGEERSLGRDKAQKEEEETHSSEANVLLSMPRIVYGISPANNLEVISVENVPDLEDDPALERELAAMEPTRCPSQAAEAKKVKGANARGTDRDVIQTGQRTSEYVALIASGCLCMVNTKTTG